MIWSIVSRETAVVGTKRLGLQLLTFGGVTAPAVPMLFYGTACWQSVQRARVYLRQCPDLERMAIVALDGDWENDTWQMYELPFRYTCRDLRIVG